MSEAIIVALITGACAIIAQALIARQNTRDLLAKMDRQSAEADARLERAQAVTDTKLEALAREVREHNGFARRLPVLEEQIKVANHRIADLEKKGA